MRDFEASRERLNDMMERLMCVEEDTNGNKSLLDVEFER